MLLLLSACSPQYNWRQVQGPVNGASTNEPEIRYSVMFPAKPASYTRPIHLNGLTVNMTLTVAEVDGTSFAIGTATLPDVGQAQATLQAMKTAMLKNINGSIVHEEASPTSINIEASGTPGQSTHQSKMRLMARFMAQDNKVVQIVVLGKEKSISGEINEMREITEPFFTSFRLNL